MFDFLRNIFRRKPQSAPLSVVPKGNISSSAIYKAKSNSPKSKYHYELKLPDIMPGVVPSGAKAGIAMDSNFNGGYQNLSAFGVHAEVSGFPGYSYLAMLSTRAEYRNFAESLSKELTREWITINSTETAGEATKKKVTELTKAIEDMDLKGTIRKAAEHDCYFGRGQIFIDIKGQENKRNIPLIISNKTIKKGTKFDVKTVEAMWTTPSTYNAIDPADKYFYKPEKWFMLGKEVHQSRLLTIITRPLPDMLKPAFNFSGMSLSQLAEPCVDNWLRTRQSVADLIDNFSTTAIKTDMGAVLSGDDDGDELFKRADLFTATRSNKGLMVLDNEREDLVQVNTPLGGLHELQAQAQEQQCSVTRLPAIIITGISPSGLNASSEGEIGIHYDNIAATQESDYREPIDTILKLLQLCMYGEIDPDITFSFVSLYQMTPKEESEIRQADSVTAGNYVDRGILDPTEVREKLARDPESGYQGLDLNAVITDPNLDEEKDDEE